MLAITLLAFGLRLFRLDHQSLWVDEAISAYLTTLSPAQIMLNRANGLHPPTYFLALAGWTALAGRSEFSLRFFSAGAGLLLVPLIYHVCRRLFDDPRTSLLAAFLAALSPASIVYAQETRMYVLLLPAYLLVLSYAPAPDGMVRRRDWIRLAACEIVCMYLHLFSVFIVVTASLLLLITRVWRDGRRVWRHWLTSQALAGLSYVPWLLVMWRWGADVPAKLSRRDWRATGMSLSRFLRLLWEFLNSGLVGAKKIDGMGHLLGALSLLLPLALLLALLLDRRRKTLLALAGSFLLPLMGSYLVWYMRPLAHPRYVLFLLAPLLIVSARAVVVLMQRPATWLLGLALSGVLLGGNVLALKHVFFDEQFFRPDMRALSAAVAERASSGEAVLMPAGDHSLWYYDPAPAESVSLPGQIGTEGGQLRLHELEADLKNRPGAFLVTYRDLRAVDPRNQIPFLLETNGRLVEQFSVERIDVEHYALEPDWTLPQLTLATIECGPLTLSGVYSQAVASADNAVAVALRWRLTEPVTSDYKATVRLWDDAVNTGGQLAVDDARLLNELGRPTSYWEAGEEAVNAYVLPLPMGTPPLTYTLGVRLYGGGHLTWQTGEEWLTLGPVRLLRAIGQAADPYGSWSGADWLAPATSEVAEGLVLEGYALRPEVLKPGDTLYVTLRWRAACDDLAHYAPRLILRRSDLPDGISDPVLAQGTGSLFERYPTDRWAAGELLIETRQLPIPPTLAPLELALVIEERTMPVGEISVTREALQWETPPTARPACARLGRVAELAGYDWTPVLDQPGAWHLTLYWRALADSPPAESYTVFTHLFDSEGMLLAQHDGLPGDGKRPTTTWLPEEIVPDRHELVLSEHYAGPVRLLVGMYDLATMERLRACDCAGRRLPADAIRLTEIAIEETP